MAIQCQTHLLQLEVRHVPGGAVDGSCSRYRCPVGMRSKSVAVAFVVAACVGLAGCSAEEPEPVKLADACSDYQQAAAKFPTGEPKASSEYLRDAASGLSAIAAAAEKNAPGLKLTDPVAGRQFERLAEAARTTADATSDIAEGEREATDSDYDLTQSVKSLMNSLNDVC